MTASGLIKADGLFYINGLSGISGFKESANVLGENDFSAGVNVYPNPATSELNIALTGFRPEASGLQGIGTLITAEGKLVKTFTLTGNQTQINVQDLHPGVYMLRIENAENVLVKRVVIQ